MSIDHVSLPIPTHLFEQEMTFLNAALAPLGLKELFRMMPTVVAMGPSPEVPFLWLSDMDGSRRKIGVDEKVLCVHLALKAKTRKEVDEFYEAGIKAGGKDNGKPGLRTEYHPNYYAAFLYSPAGHNIEAVIHCPNAE